MPEYEEKTINKLHARLSATDHSYFRFTFNLITYLSEKFENPFEITSRKKRMHWICKHLNKKKPGSHFKKDSNYILIATHELSLTGAPIAALKLAIVLTQIGFMPIIVSPTDGPLGKKLKDEKITYVVRSDAFKLKIKELKEFKYVFINTLLPIELIKTLNGTKIPTIWWIHEAKASYNTSNISNIDEMPASLSNNILTVAVSDYAKNLLMQYRKNYEISILRYYVPRHNCHGTKQSKSNNGKTIFCIIGTIDKRKNQKELVAVIKDLPRAVVNSAEFIFVGYPADIETTQSILELQKELPQSIQYVEQIDPQQIGSIYERADYLICTSIDDPLPTVVAESFEHSKPAICSKNTGFTEIFNEYKCGYLYNNSKDDLKRCIYSALNQKEIYSEFQKNCYRVYTELFTKEVFEKNIIRILSELNRKMQK
ncbi:glycosyltransferase family 4 protein [Methanomethylophilus alvi]|uniref:glycosyltransferase family 4 protein n=1 Tax=Methanomethylophilus alvi TaxID=1291540 RepID=UPI0037DC7370